MKTKIRAAAGIAGSTIMVTSIGMVYAAPAAADQVPAATDEAAQTIESADSQRVMSDTVKGTFSYSQDAVDDTKTIAQTIGKAAKYLCNSQYMEAASSTSAIAIKGDVENAYMATWEDFEGSDSLTTIMGCSCAANPVNGRISVNAQVTGIPLATMIDRAAPDKGANTIVFTSADGYEVALPLFYVMQHNGIW